MRITTIRRTLFLGLVAAAFLCAAATSTPAGNPSVMVVVRGGLAAVEVATNVPGVRIHGKSTSLSAHAAIHSDKTGIFIERLDAVVPVRSLNTGMGVRDDHMRKYIFATPGGELPDLRFVSENVSCPASDRVTTCPISGQLEIRGTAKPFDIAVKIAHDGETFRVTGDGIVKLSTYGIATPSQLGVHTDDLVKLHLEFSAAPASDVAFAGVAK
jgi:polyisoprenoid-binding protein YceI